MLMKIGALKIREKVREKRRKGVREGVFRGLYEVKGKITEVRSVVEIIA